ncbi:MAG: hypothetical protein ACXACW_14750 [Candidatus Hodarchaeales archaeon]|jgi:hypothetical protein
MKPHKWEYCPEYDTYQCNYCGCDITMVLLSTNVKKDESNYQCMDRLVGDCTKNEAQACVEK